MIVKRRELLFVGLTVGSGLAIGNSMIGVTGAPTPAPKMMRRLGPGPDMGRELNETIQDLTRMGGGTLALRDGVYGTREPIILRSNVEIVGAEKTVIKAIAAIGEGRQRRSLVETPIGQANCRIANLTLNCADQVSFAAWSAIAPQGLVSENVKVIGWHFGYYFVSAPQQSARNITIKNTIIRSGGSAQIYPVFISSKTGGPPVFDLSIDRLRIVGPRGSYSASNAATADQLAMQNVRRFKISNLESLGAGENAISIVRGCMDGTLENITVAGADGHGLQIGGGGVVATVADGSGFEKGQKVNGKTSGGKAKVDLVQGRKLWLARLTQRQLQIGEMLHSDGGASKIVDLTYCRNISVNGLAARSNGRNADEVRGRFADLYISHAEDIALRNLDLNSAKPSLSVLINNSRRIPCYTDRSRNSSNEVHAGRVICS